MWDPQSHLACRQGPAEGHHVRAHRVDAEKGDAASRHSHVTSHADNLVELFAPFAENVGVSTPVALSSYRRFDVRA